MLYCFSILKKHVFYLNIYHCGGAGVRGRQCGGGTDFVGVFGGVCCAFWHAPVVVLRRCMIALCGCLEIKQS